MSDASDDDDARRSRLERAFLKGFDERKMMVDDLQTRLDRINAQNAPVEPTLADELLKIIRSQTELIKLLQERMWNLEGHVLRLPSRAREETPRP